MTFDFTTVQKITGELFALNIERLGCRSIERREEIDARRLLLCETLLSMGVSGTVADHLRGKGF